ncbi:hypothetical protein DH2020_045428 [Rehmannia glutinosa]|uniref:Uncharacterized protein n=1 Tax=Rehmannia glutinosa TaxID=99300 RepID=A0ABR0UE54_REHGL
MAEGTRLKDLQEAQKIIDQILQTESMKREASEMKLQEQITGISSEMHDQMPGLSGKYEHLTNTLASIQLQLLNLSKNKSPMEEESILGGPYPSPTNEGSHMRLQQSPRTRSSIDQPGAQILSPLPRLEFPRFDGSHARAWILKCNSYFRLIPNIPNSQKVTLASMHFEGKASQCDELQAFIAMFEPSTLQQAIDLGKKQLHTLEAIAKKLKNPSRPYVNPSQSFKKAEAPLSVPTRVPFTTNNKQPVKLLTASEMAARREKGLCYNCDEAFTYGHRCKQRITYMIMTEEEELAYLQTDNDNHDDSCSPVLHMEEIQMSLNAITREDGITTMRLYSEAGQHRLHILIDSGSTLSFIQEATARKLGCKLDAARPLLVKVANGQRMVSSRKANNFKWKMQGHEFTYSLRLLENEGCDLILGGDWLKSCTPIELDYDKMTFTVNLLGKRVKIQALTSAAECKMILGPSLYKMMHMEFPSQIEELFVGGIVVNNNLAIEVTGGNEEVADIVVEDGKGKEEKESRIGIVVPKADTGDKATRVENQAIEE